MSGIKPRKPHTFWGYEPLRTLNKYFDDGRVEVWLSDEENNELYLIKSWQHPSGKSPIVKFKNLVEEYKTGLSAGAVQTRPSKEKKNVK